LRATRSKGGAKKKSRRMRGGCWLGDMLWGSNNNTVRKSMKYPPPPVQSFKNVRSADNLLFTPNKNSTPAMNFTKNVRSANNLLFTNNKISTPAMNFTTSKNYSSIAQLNAERRAANNTKRRADIANFDTFK
jgi:hypothetical protein